MARARVVVLVMYLSYLAMVIGANNQAGKSILKSEYQQQQQQQGETMQQGEEEKEPEGDDDDAVLGMPDLQGALRLAVKALSVGVEQDHGWNRRRCIGKDGTLYHDPGRQRRRGR